VCARALAVPLEHSSSSRRRWYATSIEQLVVGVAPVMGWGGAPAAGAERARFVRAHRKSVQRWLDDLEAAGIVAHEPERDDRGLWWRTQIVLARAPVPSASELGAAHDGSNLTRTSRTCSWQPGWALGLSTEREVPGSALCR
jgi:hypothetical protein